MLTQTPPRMLPPTPPEPLTARRVPVAEIAAEYHDTVTLTFGGVTLVKLPPAFVESHTPPSSTANTVLPLEDVVMPFQGLLFGELTSNPIGVPPPEVFKIWALSRVAYPGLFVPREHATPSMTGGAFDVVVLYSCAHAHAFPPARVPRSTR